MTTRVAFISRILLTVLKLFAVRTADNRIVAPCYFLLFTETMKQLYFAEEKAKQLDIM
jgi:hypothetical protein